MDDKQRALVVMLLTNDGADLPEHQRHVVQAALRGELSEGTALLLGEIYRETITKEAERLANL